MDIEYKTLLFKIINIWLIINLFYIDLQGTINPKHNIRMSLKIYKKILDHYNSNDRDLFLYASNLDKIGKWKKQEFYFYNF